MRFELKTMIQGSNRKASLCYSDRTSTSITDCDESSLMIGSKELFQLENYDDDIREITENSYTIANQTKCIPSVDRDDLKRISLIGSGQFCNVYSVTGNLSQPQQRENQVMECSQSRSLLAFKTIDSKRITNSRDLVVAAIDLANEAKILSQLDHKNIIRLRGISNGRYSQSFLSESENGDGFFLILDMLSETLGERLKYWRKNCKQKKRLSRSSIFQGAASKSRRDDSHRIAMYQRIENIVFGIAEGMEYLHSKQIVLRDLKPNNIGFDFDTSNQIRLFDFGMAREINDCSGDEICGSPRYMAPEVMAGKGYSLMVDVYSFGVLLFEICSLDSPYLDNYWNEKKLKNGPSSNAKNLESTMDDFYSHVVEKNLRPSDDLNSAVSCSKMRELITDCWSADPVDRPTLSEILLRLRIAFNRKE